MSELLPQTHTALPDVVLPGQTSGRPLLETSSQGLLKGQPGSRPAYRPVQGGHRRVETMRPLARVQNHLSVTLMKNISTPESEASSRRTEAR